MWKHISTTSGNTDLLEKIELGLLGQVGTKEMDKSELSQIMWVFDRTPFV